MTWREAVSAVRPREADAIIDGIDRRWKGVVVYLPMRAARLRWRGSAPKGAAERFADELRRQVLLHGGTEDDARLILLQVGGTKVWV